jgi:hypothetical protein
MKYLKPDSLTWWASFVPLCMGLFVATAGQHGMTEWAYAIEIGMGLTGPMLINAGLAGIGIRGALE